MCHFCSHVCAYLQGAENCDPPYVQGKKRAKIGRHPQAHRGGDSKQLSPLMSSSSWPSHANKEKAMPGSPETAWPPSSWTEIPILKVVESYPKANTALTLGPFPSKPWSPSRASPGTSQFLQINKLKLVRIFRRALNPCRVTNCAPFWMRLVFSLTIPALPTQMHSLLPVPPTVLWVIYSDFPCLLTISP